MTIIYQGDKYYQVDYDLFKLFCFSKGTFYLKIVVRKFLNATIDFLICPDNLPNEIGRIMSTWRFEQEQQNHIEGNSYKDFQA